MMDELKPSIIDSGPSNEAYAQGRDDMKREAMDACRNLVAGYKRQHQKADLLQLYYGGGVDAIDECLHEIEKLK